MSDQERSVSGWDAGEKLAKETSNTGLILKLEQDGDKALVVFDWRNPPYCYQSLFREDEGSLDLSTPEGLAWIEKHPKAAKNARFRARIGCYVLLTGDSDDNNLGEQLKELNLDTLAGEGSFIEVSKTQFVDIKKLRAKRPFDKYVFEIERNGAAKSKKTTYSHLNECEIGEIDGLEDHLDGVEWCDLSDPFENDDDDGDSKPGKRDNPSKRDKGERSSSSGKKAKKLSAADKAKLQGLFGGDNRKHLPALYEHLGIAKMLEITPDLMPKAEQWLEDELAGKHADPAAESDDDFFDD